MRAVATRLSAALRDSPTVGRLAGDEFVVLAEDASLDAGIELLVGRLLEVLREPFVLQQGHGRPTSHTVTASIGVADGLRDDPEALLSDADLALYRAKAAGHDCYALFAAEMHVASHDRLALESDLRTALALGQFFLEYQPTFDLYDSSTAGVEGLVRWHHPGRGVIAPLEFLATLEETGVIVPASSSHDQ